MRNAVIPWCIQNKPDEAVLMSAPESLVQDRELGVREAFLRRALYH